MREYLKNFGFDSLLSKSIVSFETLPMHSNCGSRLREVSQILPLKIPFSERHFHHFESNCLFLHYQMSPKLESCSQGISFHRRGSRDDIWRLMHYTATEAQDAVVYTKALLQRSLFCPISNL